MPKRVEFENSGLSEPFPEEHVTNDHVPKISQANLQAVLVAIQKYAIESYGPENVDTLIPNGTIVDLVQAIGSQQVSEQEATAEPTRPGPEVIGRKALFHLTHTALIVPSFVLLILIVLSEYDFFFRPCSISPPILNWF